jgi:hypothetical protein
MQNESKQQPKGLWRCPASGNIYPLCKTRTFFPFNINDVGVTSTAATDTVLLGWIWVRPVVVLFLARLLVQGRLFKVWNSG